ncbi:MAG TPA: hypothetical protein ENG98_02000 [Actinobacteria bacterium]|nr:hypothetical protein BMS3Bbin02_00771 [bacterium BMS3Bbin02]HDL41773.1 hypothetical protein [Actinomycetota bacterium]
MSRLRKMLPRRFHDEEERGATLVLAAATLLVMIGMAGFAVDLGWLYFKGAQAQNAAEAAALAGVVHMPQPSNVTFVGGEAWTTSLDIAARDGFNGGVTPSEVAGRPNRLNVSVTTTVPTFFMRVFGMNTVTMTRDATAEQLPPLKLGSDEPSLGGVGEAFWVAINGEEEVKANGDPFSTRCNAANCGSTQNGEFKQPAYYYAVDIPEDQIGRSLTIQVYDGPHWAGNFNDFRNNGDPDATGDRIDRDIDITFSLAAPDQTPNNPADNIPIGGCSRTYTEAGSEGAPGVQAWSSVCSVTAVSGIYVLSVSVDGNERAISDFALRVVGYGAGDTPAVYGLGAMSLDMVEAGTAPNFKIVKLEEFYAGSQLLISLFDPGDVSDGFANLRFVGDGAGIECEVQVRSLDGNTVLSPWGSDDTPGSAPCFLNTSGQRFNGQWVDFRFDIPPAWTCPSDCWMDIDYSFSAGANVTERTTWVARVNGEPIHLIP